jgi:hypothetical protein
MNRDLVEPFGRYVKAHSRGSFERLLQQWVRVRRDAGFPLDCNDPERTRVSNSLKEALRRVFNKVRGVQQKTKKPR